MNGRWVAIYLSTSRKERKNSAAGEGGGAPTGRTVGWASFRRGVHAQEEMQQVRRPPLRWPLGAKVDRLVWEETPELSRLKRLLGVPGSPGVTRVGRPSSREKRLRWKQGGFGKAARSRWCHETGGLPGRRVCCTTIGEEGTNADTAAHRVRASTSNLLGWSNQVLEVSETNLHGNPGLNDARTESLTTLQKIRQGHFQT